MGFLRRPQRLSAFHDAFDVRENEVIMRSEGVDERTKGGANAHTQVPVFVYRVTR